MLHVTFLAHSGFLVEDGKRCYVFDYYKDPNNIVWQLAKRGRELWFFVSNSVFAWFAALRGLPASKFIPQACSECFLSESELLTRYSDPLQ